MGRWGVGIRGRMEVAGKGGRRVNIVQKMCTDVHLNYSRNQGTGVKDSSRGIKFKYDIFDTLSELL
jgi:hypothetical protein